MCCHCWTISERGWFCGLYIVSQLVSPSSLSAAPEDFVRARWRWSLLWISPRTIYSPSNTPLLPPLRVWTQLWPYWCHSSCPALYGQVWFYTYRKKYHMVLNKTIKVQACLDTAEVQMSSTHPKVISYQRWYKTYRVLCVCFQRNLPHYYYSYYYLYSDIRSQQTIAPTE